MYNKNNLQLKWGDSYDGHGEMYYDYNHAPKYHEEPKYPAPKPVYKPAGRRQTVNSNDGLNQKKLKLYHKLIFGR